LTKIQKRDDDNTHVEHDVKREMKKYEISDFIFRHFLMTRGKRGNSLFVKNHFFENPKVDLKNKWLITSSKTTCGVL
jgi:hypothetical protein